VLAFLREYIESGIDRVRLASEGQSTITQ
jgi:hypothetical protein